MWGIIDLPTLVILIATAIGVGLYGAFGVDVLAIAGGHERQVQMIVGASGIWQLFRQPGWFG